MPQSAFIPLMPHQFVNNYNFLINKRMPFQAFYPFIVTFNVAECLQSKSVPVITYIIIVILL